MKVDKAYTVDGKVLTIPEIAVGDSVVVQYAIDRTLIDTDMVTSRVTVTCDQGASDDSELSVLLETEADTSTDTSSDSTDESSDKTNTDSTGDSSDKTNTDSTDDSGTDTSTDTSSDKKESEDEPLKLMMGDVDMDGKVTSKDALLIQRYTIGIDKFIDVQKLLGDVNGDGKVSAADGMIILRWTIKLPTKSTTGEMVEIPKDMLSLVKK